ncbi:MAG TPA: efflux RND transporter periplasmic adaptor subunit [Gammaproteobacteria bacterium]|nr:efflux RND transporter periplasmic adaptor subunit [Gammaproteobacteria bacterium]
MISKKWLIIDAIIIIIIILFASLHSCKKNNSTNQEVIAVKKGTVKEKIIAVGSIVPKHTISVKSNISGIVGQLFHEEGDFVDQNALLLQVSPSPTPQSIAEAHANVKEQEANLEQTESHRQRLQQLLKLSLETPDNYAVAVKDVATNKARLEMAKQKLALLQKGETNIAGKSIKTMVNSPISGYILQRNVDLGDPVVPLTDSQAGTVLFVIANMDDLIFKGLVNEVDVAKISSGMIANIRIAAIPDVTITGTLRKVDLQANNQSATTTTTTTGNSPFNVGFNIELDHLTLPKDIKLRAGYSATAEITVQQAENVVVIPERVLIFKDNKVYVHLQPDKNHKKPIEKEIVLGLSDGIQAEVKSGLVEGEKIFDNNNPTTKS